MCFIKSIFAVIEISNPLRNQWTSFDKKNQPYMLWFYTYIYDNETVKKVTPFFVNLILNTINFG